jgi:hypothetical protein
MLLTVALIRKQQQQNRANAINDDKVKKCQPDLLPSVGPSLGSMKRKTLCEKNVP